MFYLHQLVLFSLLGLTVANDKIQPMYRIENDFVYKVQENYNNRPLNPNTIVVVKNISLYEIQNSVSILALLSKKITSLCTYLLRKETLRTPNMLFQIFKGQFTKSTGQNKCKKENLKLIEIRNNQQLWLFSTLLNNKNIETPMGAYFDQESGKFLFDSDGTPFNSGPVKNSTGGNALLPRYDKIIYRNHHLSYVFDKGYVYFQLNLPIFRKYPSIICIPTDIKGKTDLEKVCERDVKMSKDMVTESRYLVHSYQNSLKLLDGNHEQHIQRKKEGL